MSLVDHPISQQPSLDTPLIWAPDIATETALSSVQFQDCS
jgi:hypothetical protein